MQGFAEVEPLSHDYEQQRNDTLQAWRDISSRHAVPDEIELDIQFVPHGEPLWSDAEIALAAAGYRVVRYDDGSTLQATVGPVMNTPEEIWKHERATTELALKYGFKPDGWGFLSDPGNG